MQNEMDPTLAAASFSAWVGISWSVADVTDLLETNLFKAESKTPPHDVIRFSGQFSTTEWMNCTAMVLSLALVLPAVPKSRSKMT